MKYQAKQSGSAWIVTELRRGSDVTIHDGLTEADAKELAELLEQKSGAQLPATPSQVTWREVSGAVLAGALHMNFRPNRELVAMLLAHSACVTKRWSEVYWYNLGNVIATPPWILNGGDYCFRVDDKGTERRYRAHASLTAGGQAWFEHLLGKHAMALVWGQRGSATRYADAVPGLRAGIMAELYEEFSGKVGVGFDLSDPSAKKPSGEIAGARTGSWKA